jgi:hypothetical protein
MLNLLNQKLKVYTTPNTNDEWGRMTFDEYKETKCRFVRTSKFFKNQQGDDLGITAKIQSKYLNYFIGQVVEYNQTKYVIVSINDWRGQNTAFGTLIYVKDYPTFE